MRRPREPIWVLLFVGSLSVDVGAFAGRVRSETTPTRRGLLDRAGPDRTTSVATTFERLPFDTSKNVRDATTRASADPGAAPDRHASRTGDSISSSGVNSAESASGCVYGCAFEALERERNSFAWRSASPRELRRLPGVGEVRALAIARERWIRQADFGWANLEELPGIGPETARRIRAATATDPRQFFGPQFSGPKFSSSSSSFAPFSASREPRSGSESASTPTTGLAPPSPAPMKWISDDRRP